MEDFKIYVAAPGAEVVSVPADRFKTNEIAITLITPLSSENAAVNAAVPFVLSRTCAAYPAINKLNERLAYLYGAKVLASSLKTGEAQQLKIGVTCLDDRFSLDGEKITADCVKLLLSMVFEPLLDENGVFPKENVEMEKRALIQKIESEDNEKRTYALKRAQEIMFSGEPFAVNRYGTKEQAQAITAAGAASAWRRLLETSKIVVSLVGSANGQEIANMLSEKLADIKRAYQPMPLPKAHTAGAVKRETERQQVRQGKLVMGFGVDADPADMQQAAALRSFADIFGGGPYSKLFANVREKMSLCYYCSAVSVRQKSCLFVQSGCEEENMQKAEREILNQLEEIKKGNFDYEFNSSKTALNDALDSVYDSPETTEAWYGVQSPEGNYCSPAESAKRNNAVTKDQIIALAKTVSLDTVYRLVSEKEGE